MIKVIKMIDENCRPKLPVTQTIELGASNSKVIGLKVWFPRNIWTEKDSFNVKILGDSETSGKCIHLNPLITVSANDNEKW